MKVRSCNLKELIFHEPLSFYRILSFNRIEEYLTRVKDLYLKLDECGKDFLKKEGHLIELIMMNLKTPFDIFCSMNIRRSWLMGRRMKLYVSWRPTLQWEIWFHSSGINCQNESGRSCLTRLMKVRSCNLKELIFHEPLSFNRIEECLTKVKELYLKLDECG
jgi:hypothetical protein